MSIIRHENEIRDLREQINALEKRVEAMESKPKAGRPPKSDKQEKSA